MEKKLQIVELFAGVGAFSQALSNLQIPYQTLFISENKKNAEDIFQKLHRKVKNLGDITQISEKKIIQFKNECDVLCFGSPCQDFSQAGFNKGGEPNSNTRSSLIWEALRIIKIIKPKTILFENVKNLKTRHQEVLRTLKKELRQENYLYRTHIINSLHYNIPQNRPRLFLIALRKDTFKNKPKFKFRKKPYVKKKTLKTFLSIDNFNNRKILENIKLEHNYTNFKTWTDKKGNKNGSYNRAWKINNYCGALSFCNRIKITDNTKVSHLTAEESWLLMGFSKKQFNKVKNTCPSEQTLISLAGNSVVVKIWETIINKLQKFINPWYKKAPNIEICLQCYAHNYCNNA